MVSCIKYASAVKNLLKWPSFPDVIKYKDSEIICGILPPLPLKQSGDYKLMDDQFKKAQKVFQATMH